MSQTLEMGTAFLGHSPASVQGAVAKSAPADARDFERIYAAHVDFVWRALKHLGVPPASLDDAVQEVFVVVHRRGHEFEGRSSIRTWLYGIAVGIARNVRRSGRRHGHVEPLEPWLEAIEHHERPDASAEARDLVCEGLDRLDGERREVLVLADIEELTAPEIAEALQIPLGTVYSRLRTARREFEEAVRALESSSAWRTR